MTDKIARRYMNAEARKMKAILEIASAKSLPEAIAASHEHRPYSEQPFNWAWGDHVISTWPDGRAYLNVNGAYRTIPPELMGA